MAAKIDQKAYLQRYLSGGSSVDKKKKKKKVSKGNGFKIIDDDIDLTKLRPLDGDELDILDQGEDGPQIAGIIDERPEEVKKLEQFKTSSKWRVVTQDDGFHSKLQIEEIKSDVKEAQKENELIFGKMYSDSEDEKQNDSDLSPPRIRPFDRSNHRETKKKQNNSDSDFSPPRKERESAPRNTNKQDNDSDISPPRIGISSTRKEQRSRKPSRWDDVRSKSKSPSPKRSKHTHKSSHSRKKSRSPTQKSSKKESAVRNRSPSNDTYQKKNTSYEFDTVKYRNEDDRLKSKEKKHHKDKKNMQQQSNADDSDLSPLRKNNSKSESPVKKSSKKIITKRKRDSSSDVSPPRRESIRNTRAIDRNYKGRNRDSPPPSNKKMEKTLDEKKACLQDARQWREENEAFRRREDDAFNKMADEVSGRNATAVSRKASKRDTSEERRKQKEKAERQKELDEKYKKWSKGLKQIEAQEARMQDFIHEASKPLARHKDDRDLENSLKDVLRDGDPMLQYIIDKKRERGELGPEKPIYKGKFPPNRFNIRPGYRWDGVDRSNGYEKKYFEQQSKRKAQEEEACKWSTEDL